MRHYAKVIVGVPTSHHDPPEIMVRIECDVCDTQEIRIHPVHVATLLNTLGDVYETLVAMGRDDGTGHTTDFGAKADLKEAQEFLDKAYPEWKANRIKVRGRDRK